VSEEDLTSTTTTATSEVPTGDSGAPPDVQVSETPEPVVAQPEGFTTDDFRNNSRFLRRGPQNNPSVEAEPTPSEVDPGPEEGAGETQVEETREPVNEIVMPDGERLTFDQILEMKKGNMLQADYTRKTQELAEERKRFQQEQEEYRRLKELPIDDAMGLWESLANDPIGTIEYLREHYESQGITEPRDPEVIRIEQERAKLEAENKKLKADNEAKQLEASKIAFQKYLDELSVKYKDQGFDKDAVLGYCMKNGIPDPEIAFKAMIHDTMLEKFDIRIKDLEAKLEQEKKGAVANYVKGKVVNSATHVPPVGGGNSGTGVSISTPKGWRAARKAALDRLNNMP